MKNLIKTGLVWAGILWSFSAWGQRLPLGTLPVEYNGSFAGEAGGPRLSTNFTYSLTNWQSVFKSQALYSSLSYDQFVPVIRSGIGITADAGKFDVETTSSGTGGHGSWRSFSLNVAPKISIKGKHTISPSVSLRYWHQASMAGRQETRRYENINSSVGLLWNTSKYYIGYSFNGPVIHQDIGRRGPYRFRSMLQAGYTFQRSSESNFSFTPQLVVSLQKYGREGRDFRQMLHLYVPGYNLNFRYKKVIWGVNNTGVHIGFQSDQLRLMITNDTGYFTYGGFLEGHKQYNGNLSFRYTFQKKTR